MKHLLLKLPRGTAAVIVVAVPLLVLPLLSVGSLRAQLAGEETVEGRAVWLDPGNVPSQYRIEPMPFAEAYRILLSMGGRRFCLVDGRAYALAKEGEKWLCVWRWLRPQHP
jgi:hypothetical protein